MQWTVYLSGEIHTDWREQLAAGAEQHNLSITFTSAVTDHAASDAAGDVLDNHVADLPNSYWRDHQSSRVNAMRTQVLLKQCDVAVVRFGEKYKQWNAAFDAGYLAALGKPYITLHDNNIIHPLKEVDGAAAGWAQTPEQVIEILRYIIAEK